MKLLKEEGLIKLYEDEMEANDGTKMKFKIIGVTSESERIGRDAKGTLLVKKDTKILFIPEEQYPNLQKVCRYNASPS